MSEDKVSLETSVLNDKFWKENVCSSSDLTLLGEFSSPDSRCPLDKYFVRRYIGEVPPEYSDSN